MLGLARSSVEIADDRAQVLGARRIVFDIAAQDRVAALDARERAEQGPAVDADLDPAAAKDIAIEDHAVADVEAVE